MMGSSKVIKLGGQKEELSLHNSTEQHWLEEHLDKKEEVRKASGVDS